MKYKIEKKVHEEVTIDPYKVISMMLNQRKSSGVLLRKKSWICTEILDIVPGKQVTGQVWSECEFFKNGPTDITSFIHKIDLEELYCLQKLVNLHEERCQG